MSKGGRFGRRKSSGPPFIQVYHHIYDSREYRRLSSNARALLLEFGRRFNGHNNGNLEMTARQFKEAGLGSEPTMRKYMAELINNGWIVVTRYGGMRSGPNLYALTYFGIDQTNVTYDHPHKADAVALNLWRDEKADQRIRARAPTPRSGLARLLPQQLRTPQSSPVIAFPARQRAS